MHRFRIFVVLLMSVLLMVGPTEGLWAQQKKKTPTTQTTKKSGNTQTTKKGSTTTTKKSNTSPAKSTTKRTTNTNTKKNNNTTTGNKGNNKGGGKTNKKSSEKKQPMSRQAYEKQQKDLQRQIKDTENLISANDKSVRSQNRDLKIRQDEINKRKALIVSQQREIDVIIQEEDSLKNEIQFLQKSYAEKQKKYAAAVRHMYKWRSGYDEMSFVLSASDMFEGLRRMRYLRSYGQWRKQQATELEEQRLATEKAKNELEQTRSDRQRVLAAMDVERQNLTLKQQEQERQVANLQQRNKELQSELDRDRKKMAEVEQTIQRLIQEEIRKAEEARKKAEEEARRKAEAEKKKKDKSASSSTSSSKSSTSSDTKTGSSSSASKEPTYTVDPNYKRLTGSFVSNKGKLPYPLDANFAFVDHYNTAGNGNSSIVLSTKAGAHACAIFEGTVQSCFSTSEEWTVIVQHGEYRSVYMNLRNVSVKVGQKVSIRQALGTLKTEPDTNRAELRFWIYHNADAVNPERWLKR